MLNLKALSITMPNLKALSIICTSLQIIGYALIPAAITSSSSLSFAWVIIGISGFAAVVKVFLPLESHQGKPTTAASFCGFGIIILSCLKVAGVI